MTGPDPNAEYWRTTEVAAYAGTTSGTISSYRNRGQMPTPAISYGRTHLWRPADIIAWRAELEREPPPPRDEPPRYKALADLLRRRIRDGEFRPGDRIPPERDLANLYRVSRPTTTKAVDILRREGIVVSGKRGTYVTTKPIAGEGE